MYLRENLSYLRNKSKLSQIELGQKLGVSGQTVLIGKEDIQVVWQ